METRLLIAYLLMAVLVAAAALLARHFAVKRRQHRQLMRGQGLHRRASARR
jgi:hypothetical protein